MLAIIFALKQLNIPFLIKRLCADSLFRVFEKARSKNYGGKSALPSQWLDFFTSTRALLCACVYVLNELFVHWANRILCKCCEHCRRACYARPDHLYTSAGWNLDHWYLDEKAAGKSCRKSFQFRCSSSQRSGRAESGGECYQSNAAGTDLERRWKITVHAYLFLSSCYLLSVHQISNKMTDMRFCFTIFKNG